MPIYWHPSLVAPQIIDYYYMSGSYSAQVGAELSSAGFGWHLNVGIEVIRMVLSGIFDKLSGLKFISGHWGEDIPAYLERMDYMLGADHIIWAEDYPFILDQPIRFFLDKSDLSEEQKYAIARGNAEKLLKITR